MIDQPYVLFELVSARPPSHRAPARRPGLVRRRGTREAPPGGGGDVRVTVRGAAPRWTASCRALLLAVIAACAGEGAMPGAGTITRVAGRGPAGPGDDGGPASAAGLGRWLTIAVDAAGNVFIADLFAHRVRRVDAATGSISVVAGSGERGFAGDGGPARAARLGRIQG